MDLVRQALAAAQSYGSCTVLLLSLGGSARAAMRVQGVREVLRLPRDVLPFATVCGFGESDEHRGRRERGYAWVDGGIESPKLDIRSEFGRFRGMGGGESVSIFVVWWACAAPPAGGGP